MSVLEIDWRTVLAQAFTAFVAGIGGIAAAGWATKRILTHWLDKDIKKFESDLQHTYDVKLEQFKNDHAIRELEHETRFKTLHQRRFELIGDLYSKLVASQQAMERYVSGFVTAGSPSEEARGKLAADTWNDLNTFFQTHRLFFTADECVLIAAYIKCMREAHLEFLFKGFMGAPEAQAWRRVEEKLNSEAGAARTSLEESFRLKLGLSKEESKPGAR